ncbi:MAG: hypothetical protein GEV10_29675 [Streptosporangiales bacterium]|nr:hypothetical protein [Streptosporangiales bacterium]
MTTATVTRERTPSRARAIGRTRYLPLPSGWPLYAMFVLFPVWWALGLGSFALPALTLPMVYTLWRRRPLRVPKGFGIWLLFLLWVAVSATTLDVAAPGTLAGDVATRALSAASRFFSYLAVTVVLLYVGNLSERELPRRRVIAVLGVFFLEVTALGCLALAWPQGGFTSPLELVLPDALRHTDYVQQLVHPQMAQNMTILGHSAGRPAAPFPYTNGWGSVISTLLVWLIVWWWAWGGTRRKVAAAVVIAVAAVPIVYSLNRGVWIGLVVAVLYVGVRMAIRGHGRVLASVLAAIVVVAAIVMATPLQKVIVERINNPHSNAGRAAQDMLAVEGAASSPVIGYGSTRNMAGSRQSIAIGKSADCPRCGNSSTGGAGQIWLLMFAHGFVGAALYVGFFAYVLWRHRHDYSAVGVAAATVIVLSFVYLPFYGAIGMPLTLAFVAIGLLWRNASERLT